MKFNSILKQQEVQNILEKSGIPQNQIEAVANQAFEVINHQLESHPNRMSSLLSNSEHVEANKRMQAEIEHEFVNNLVRTVGIPEHKAREVKAILPSFYSEFSEKISLNARTKQSEITDSLKSKDSKEKYPFANPPKNDPHQGHGRAEKNKSGVQFKGGHQGGGAFKKDSKD